MAAIGYASLPVTVSLRGLQSSIRDGLQKPMEQASKRAGDAMAQGLASGADRAARDYENAQRKAERATKRVQDAESALEAARSATRAATERLKAAEADREATTSRAQRKIADAEADYQKLLESGEASAEDLAEAEAKVTRARLEGERDIARKEAAYESAREKSRKAAEGAEAAEEKLSQARLSAEDAADNVTAAEVRLSEETDNAAESMAEASEESERFSKRLDGLAFAAVGLATGAFAGLVSIGNDFRETTRIIAVGSGAVGEDLASLEESARQVATTVPMSFNEAGEAIANLNTFTGESGEAIERLAEQVGNAANLLGEDAVGATEAYGKALNQWGLTADEGAEAADGLFAITQNTGIGFSELSGQLTSFGSTMKNAGFSMEETAGFFGNLSSAGLSVSRIMPGLNKSFRDWADEGKDVQAELAGVVEQIENAESSQEALAIAADTFGAQGAQRLTDAIRGGQFTLEDFSESLGDTAGLIDQTAEDNRTFSESFEMLKNEALVALEPIATELVNRLIPAVQGLTEWLTGAIDWLKDNKEMVEGVAVAVGSAAGAFVAWRTSMMLLDKAQQGFQIATALSTDGVKGLNRAMRRNIFGLIATAIVGAISALVWFLTETETGQAIVEGFVNGITKAFEWLQEKVGGVLDWISNAFEGLKGLFLEGDFNEGMAEAFGISDDHPLIVFFFKIRDVVVKAGEIIGKVFDFIVQAGKVLFAVLATVVLTPLMIQWNILSSVISWAWEKVIKPAWEALSDFAVSMWENYLSPVFTWIGEKFSDMSGTLGAVWAWIRENVFQPLQDAVSTLWAKYVDPVLSWISEKWTWLSNALKYAWDWIQYHVIARFQFALMVLWNRYVLPVLEWIKGKWDWLSNALNAGWLWVQSNVIQPIQNALMNLWNRYVVPVLDWIKEKWDWLTDKLHAGWRWVDENVFSALKNGLQTVQDSFQTAVDAIRRIWDKVKAAAAKPIRWVLDVVVNNGLLKAWNTVAGWVGLEEKEPIKLGELGNYSQGTHMVPGPRSVNHDNMRFISADGRYGINLAGGEGIAHQRVVDVIGRDRWDRMNAAAVAGNYARVEHELGGFNSGGVIGSMEAFVGKHWPSLLQNGRAFSGYRPGDPGHHGSGLAADFSNAGNEGSPEMKQLATAIDNMFKDQTLELIHWPLSGWQNIKNGEYLMYDSATNEAHRNHVHWALPAPLQAEGVDLDLSGYSGGGGGGFSLASLVKRAWDGVINTIGEFTETTGDWAKIPGAFLKTAANSVWDFISEKVSSMVDLFTGGSGSGAEAWRETAAEALRRTGYGDEVLDAMVRQIEIESGGDPNAINLWDSNAAQGMPSGGLLQVIEPTYRDMRNLYPERFEGLPDDRFHPMTNLVAGITWAEHAYGHPLNRWPTTAGYAHGGILPPDLSNLFLYDMGGILPHGGMGINLSGAPEIVINNDQLRAFNTLANNLGAATHELRIIAREGWPAIQAVADELNHIVWTGSERSGILGDSPVIREAALQFADQVSNVIAFGQNASLQEWSDLLHQTMLSPLVSYADGMIDAQANLQDAYREQSEAAAGVVEAEEALAEARAELDEALAGTAALSEATQDKLTEAEEALAEARDAGDADGIAEAEKKLAEVREDAQAELEEAEAEQAETIKAAREAVADAELDLADARGVVVAAAKAAGIAEIEMILAVVDTIKTVVSDLIDRALKTRIQVTAALSDSFAAIAEWVGIVEEQRQTVSELRMQVVNDQIALRDAIWATRTAEADYQRARFEGLVNVARAEESLESAREGAYVSAALSVSDLHYSIDRFRESGVWAVGNAIDSVIDMTPELADKLEDALQRFHRTGLWSVDGVALGVRRMSGDVAAAIAEALAEYRRTGVFSVEMIAEAIRQNSPEIMAREHDLNAARLTALAGEKQAALDAARATYEQQLAAFNLTRTTQSLARATARLQGMSDVEAQFGMNQQQATVAMRIAELMAENAEIAGERDSLDARIRQGIGGIASLLDWNNDGSILFGLVDNPWHDERRLLDEHIAQNQQDINRLLEHEFAPNFSDEEMREIREALDEAARQFAADNEAAARAALAASPLGRAERATEWNALESELAGIDEELANLEAQIRESQMNLDFEEWAQPQRELIAALEAQARAEEYRAEADRESNDRIAAELERWAEFEAAWAEQTAARASDPERTERVELTVNLPDKAAYSADEVVGIIEQMNQSQSALEIRVQQLENRGRDGAGYAASHR